MSTRALRAILLLNESSSDHIIEHLEGIRAELVVHRAESDRAVLDMLREVQPDVILTDRSLGASGVYDAIRRRRPEAAIIFVADVLDEDTVVSFLRDGADDLVLCRNLPRLRRAIEESLETRKALAALSPRQIEVLMRVAEGKSTREIAELLGLSAKTVESHRGAMMKRLGIHDLATLVRYAVRLGLVRNIES